MAHDADDEARHRGARRCLREHPAMAMITDIEDYFTLGCGRCERHATPDCSTRGGSTGSTRCAGSASTSGLSEHVKWAHPCYMHAGRNICADGGLSRRLPLQLHEPGFVERSRGRARTKRPEHPHRRDAAVHRYRPGPESMEPIIRAYLAEAMGYAEAGIQPPKVEPELDLPDELVEALDADPELAEAFHALTPGRQKSYVDQSQCRQAIGDPHRPHRPVPRQDHRRQGRNRAVIPTHARPVPRKSGDSDRARPSPTRAHVRSPKCSPSVQVSFLLQTQDLTSRLTCTQGRA